MIEHILYQDEVEAEPIFELAIAAICVPPNGGDVGDSIDIVRGLIRAYVAIHQRDDEPCELTETKEQSWKTYQDQYFAIWPEVKDADGMGWYPDSLPDEGGIPVRILKMAATVIARKEKAEQRAWAKWYKENYPSP